MQGFIPSIKAKIYETYVLAFCGARTFYFGGFMETRIAQIGIIVESPESVEKMNQILHQYGEYIVGRMGIPYKKRGVSVISIIIDAPSDVISALSGKLGMIEHIKSKTLYANI